MQVMPVADKFSRYYRNDLKMLFELVGASGGKKLVLGLKELSGPTKRNRYNSTYDYIFMPDSLGYVYDIGKTFRQIKILCKPQTRVVFNYQNPGWQVFLDLAEMIGLKTRRPRVNWLEREDIENLLRLEGYEIVKTGKRFLCPIPMGAISEFLNRYIANLPIINRMCLTNYVVSRPEAKIFAVKPTVSIIIPARNEAGNIKKIPKAFGKITPKPEIIFVEGHSSDNTWEEIQKVKDKFRNINILAVKQSGTGKADAVRKGMDLAQKDVLIIWDADLTVSPDDFSKFYEAVRSGKGEFVFGSRLVYPPETDSMRTLNMWGNIFFSRIFTWLLGQPIKDTLCGTKVISRENYRKLAANRRYFGDFDPFGDFDLLFGAARMNLKFAEIPVRYHPRSYGRTNISRFTHGWLLFKMVFFALDKIKFTR